jgi:hypothetical protein
MRYDRDGSEAWPFVVQMCFERTMRGFEQSSTRSRGGSISLIRAAYVGSYSIAGPAGQIGDLGVHRRMRCAAAQI